MPDVRLPGRSNLAWAMLAGLLACGGGGATGDGGADAAAVAGCQQVASLARSCARDSDCVAVHHMTSCCGGMAWLGIQASEQQRFMTLETQCVDSYPACGCYDGRDSTDDGSRIPRGGSAAATCQAGICKTYAPACGRLCADGSSCLTCTEVASGTVTSVCSPRCTDDSTCDATAPRCDLGQSTGLCAPANATCEPGN